MKRILLDTLFLNHCAGDRARAAASWAKADEIPAHQMTLSPAGESEPALRWRLLPELRDTTPGNAVQLYYRCFSPEWLNAYRRDHQKQEALNAAESHAARPN